MEHQLIAFILTVLDDDHGISQDSYNAINCMRGCNVELDAILDAVDAIDGRYFLPSDHPIVVEFRKTFVSEADQD